MAKKPLADILDRISCALKELDQETIFASPAEKHKTLSEACKKYLRYQGFKVIAPEKSAYNIKKLDDLIHLFYSFSDRSHPELMSSYRSFDRDRKIASGMVKARMEANGYGMPVAMNECAEIIETVFNHESEFNFKIPISFGILGQKNCGWITDKAIQIINRKRIKADKERRKKCIAELDKRYDAEPDGFGDLDEILESSN